MANGSCSIESSIMFIVDSFVAHMNAFDEEWTSGEVLAVFEGAKMELFQRFLKRNGFVRMPWGISLGFGGPGDHAGHDHNHKPKPDPEEDDGDQEEV